MGNLNKSIIELGFQTIAKISEEVIHQAFVLTGSSSSIWWHNYSHHTQPHSIILIVIIIFLWMVGELLGRIKRNVLTHKMTVSWKASPRLWHIDMALWLSICLL